MDCDCLGNATPAAKATGEGEARRGGVVGCVGQKQTMASTSLTALIAVIRLKSHTRDFCDQAQDDHWSGLVWFGLVWLGLERR